MIRAAPRPALAELLRQHGDAIVRRWAADILATYPGEAAAVFGREQDRFANPIGHSVRAGTRGIVEALGSGSDPDRIRNSLRDIIQVRAIQHFTPSRAVSFVFWLKVVIREELGDTGDDPAIAAELAALDGVIDGIALTAFDVFSACREQVYQLRIDEVKRQVAWVVDKMNQREAEPVLP